MDINLKIERWRAKAELFLENDIKIFIKTLDGSFHSGDILLVGENSLTFYDIFQKEKFRVYWLDMELFKEYEEMRVKNDYTQENPK